MGKLLEIATSLHNKTRRDYVARMSGDKVFCMQKAKQYGKDFWDGERRFGYGGYKYDGRWKGVAERLIKEYGLSGNSKILDVGCGKAHLLYELKRLLPGAQCSGFDISQYAIDDAPIEIRDELFLHSAQDLYPYRDKEFDLVISLATLHNLKIFDLKTALGEIQRVGKQGFVMVEAYRDEQEMFNLECWALTMESLFHTSEWIWLYSQFGYKGDYEFIYFE